MGFQSSCRLPILQRAISPGVPYFSHEILVGAEWSPKFGVLSPSPINVVNPQKLLNHPLTLVGGFSEKYESVSWDDFSHLNGKIIKSRSSHPQLVTLS